MLTTRTLGTNNQHGWDAASVQAQLQQQMGALAAYSPPLVPTPAPTCYDPLRMVATGIQFTKHHDDPENTFRLYNGMGSIDFMLMVDLNQNPPQLVLISCSVTPKP